MERTALTVLFLGDSITAGTRNIQDSTHLGEGYPKYVADSLRAQFPQTQFTFFNRGVWGNETKDLLARIETDAVELNPDITVLFIGVNDTLRHAFTGDLSIEQFCSQYGQILDVLKEKTHTKLLVVEPYLLIQDKYERFKKRFDLLTRIDGIRKTSKGKADGYLPLDGLFAKLHICGDAESYTEDGLHPNALGARFIGEQVYSALMPIVYSLTKGE